MTNPTTPQPEDREIDIVTFLRMKKRIGWEYHMDKGTKELSVLINPDGPAAADTIEELRTRLAALSRPTVSDDAVSAMREAVHDISERLLKRADLLDGDCRIYDADDLRDIADAIRKVDLPLPVAPPVSASDDVRDLLTECARTFRTYEQNHLAKKTQKGDEKAYRNKVMADKIEAAISAMRAREGK